VTGNRPFVLGLTGSIGMGKSTTAGFFREFGIPVWDADAAVHRLYASGAAGTARIADLFPQAINDSGVDRAALRNIIATDPTAMGRIEALIHPLVARDRAEFVRAARKSGEWLVVVDIPLLFETGGESGVDATLVVSAPADVQRQRVLARAEMTPAHFARILASQTPDPEKRARADYVIQTTSLAPARTAVAKLLAELKDGTGPDA